VIEFRNLAAEKARYKVSNKMIAEVIGKSIDTVDKKMSGAIDWKANEMLAIKRAFFPQYTLDYLFEPYEV
jgi:hypothetical protein